MEEEEKIEEKSTLTLKEKREQRLHESRENEKKLKQALELEKFRAKYRNKKPKK